jgi:hypothetical protein
MANMRASAWEGDHSTQPNGGAGVADIVLTQAEADALMAMPKRQSDDEWRDYPVLGGAVSVPLVSMDRREAFVLDIHRGHIDMVKGTYQNRARRAIVLARLDFGAQSHRNPDGEEVGCPHLHVYREGHGDKWAVALSEEAFSDPDDRWALLQDFVRYCSIIEAPLIRRRLFV